MKKIIINPRNHNAVEISLNDRFAPYMGMNQVSYRQLVIKEEDVLQKLSCIVLRGKLPKDIVPSETDEDAINVLKKVISLMKIGFHVAIIISILRITVGEKSGFGPDFHHRFEPLFQDEECREDFWSSSSLSSCTIAIMLLDKLMSS